MELNVAYMLQKPEESWRIVKSVLRQDSVHVAYYFATGHSYNDKKTMLNVTSRMNLTRSSFYVVCTLEQISDIISHAEEVCNLFPLFKYNILAEHCVRTSQLRMIVGIGPGLLTHGQHKIKSLRTVEDLQQSDQARLMESSIRQELCLLIGDKSFESLVDITKKEARYVVTFTSDSTEVVATCRQKGITAKKWTM